MYALSTLRLALPAAALAATVLAAGAAAVQDDQELPLISLEFKGGTALEYVAAIRHKAAGRVNIVAALEAADIEVPAMTLTDVSPPAALQVLEGLSGRQAERAVDLKVEGIPVFQDGERPTFQVIAKVSGRPAGQRTTVLSVADLMTSGLGSDAVLSAIEMALEVDGGHEHVDVRFHKETGILVGRGGNEQLDVLSQVVARLRESQGLAGLKAAAAERDQVRAKLDEMSRVNDGLQQQVAQLQMRLRELEFSYHEAQAQLLLQRPRGQGDR